LEDARLQAASRDCADDDRGEPDHARRRHPAHGHPDGAAHPALRAEHFSRAAGRASSGRADGGRVRALGAGDDVMRAFVVVALALIGAVSPLHAQKPQAAESAPRGVRERVLEKLRAIDRASRPGGGVADSLAVDSAGVATDSVAAAADSIGGATAANSSRPSAGDRGVPGDTTRAAAPGVDLRDARPAEPASPFRTIPGRPGGPPGDTPAAVPSDPAGRAGAAPGARVSGPP